MLNSDDVKIICLNPTIYIRRNRSMCEHLKEQSNKFVKYGNIWIEHSDKFIKCGRY